MAINKCREFRDMEITDGWVRCFRKQCYTVEGQMLWNQDTTGLEFPTPLLCYM
jgi:hypothetical protein